MSASSTKVPSRGLASEDGVTARSSHGNRSEAYGAGFSNVNLSSPENPGPPEETDDDFEEVSLPTGSTVACGICGTCLDVDEDTRTLTVEIGEQPQYIKVCPKRCAANSTKTRDELLKAARDGSVRFADLTRDSLEHITASAPKVWSQFWEGTRESRTQAGQAARTARAFSAQILAQLVLVGSGMAQEKAERFLNGQDGLRGTEYCDPAVVKALDDTEDQG